MIALEIKDANDKRLFAHALGLKPTQVSGVQRTAAAEYKSPKREAAKRRTTLSRNSNPKLDAKPVTERSQRRSGSSRG